MAQRVADQESILPRVSEPLGAAVPQSVRAKVGEARSRANSELVESRGIPESALL
jgi:hypothetical protein